MGAFWGTGGVKTFGVGAGLASTASREAGLVSTIGVIVLAFVSIITGAGSGVTDNWLIGAVCFGAMGGSAISTIAAFSAVGVDSFSIASKFLSTCITGCGGGISVLTPDNPKPVAVKPPKPIHINFLLINLKFRLILGLSY